VVRFSSVQAHFGLSLFSFHPLVAVFVQCEIFKYYLLHGSVAICLRCDVIFSGQFIANLPLSVPVKEF